MVPCMDSVDEVGHPANVFAGISILKQDLTDRIKELCARAVDAPDSEWESILAELRSALYEHVAEMRYMAAENLGRPRELKRSERNRRERV